LRYREHPIFNPERFALPPLYQEIGPPIVGEADIVECSFAPGYREIHETQSLGNKARDATGLLALISGSIRKTDLS